MSPYYPPYYPGQPQAAPPAAYPPPPPEKTWPVPQGRLIPVFWAGGLIFCTIVAIALALLAPSLVPTTPTTAGSTTYQNTLAHADGQWQTKSLANGRCAYEAGGLHATAQNIHSIVPSCLFAQDQGDLRFSVRILPQFSANIPRHPMILVHSDVAFTFADDGSFEIFHLVGRQLVKVKSGVSGEWHNITGQSNTLTIVALGGTQGEQYTLAVNGTMTWQGTISGASTGTLALGAHGVNLAFTDPNDGTGEAIFADAVLSQP